MPTFRVTDPNTGRVLRLTGDSPPTQEELEGLFSEFDVSQVPAEGDSFPGASIIEPLATVATGIPATIAGGLAGIGTALNPFTDLDPAQAVENVTDLLTFDPKTPGGQQGLLTLAKTLQPLTERLQQLEEFQAQQGFAATGSPAVAAAGAAVPAAIGELIGLSTPGRVGRIAGRSAERAAARRGRLTEEVSQLRDPSPEEGLKAVTEAIQKSPPEEVAALVRPDPAFFAAADELNINVEPLASFASQNPQFRALEQGLASIPASQLDAQGKAFVGALSQKADDLIVEYGGTLDKASLSDRFRADSIQSIDDLAKQADQLYESLSVKIPSASKVEAVNTVDFLTQKAAELGGRKELPPRLNKILRQLETTQKTIPSGRIDVITGRPVEGKTTTKAPTYERLNQTRREVGQALNSRSGPFKDQETGLLKALYKRLRTDQDVVAGSFDAGDVSDSANALIRQRKQIEDNLSKLLGKDLEGSILPKVGQALKRLSKGDVQQWDSTMARIPKDVRQEIVVSSLNDVFKGTGLQGKALNPTQFTKFMDDLDRSPATKSRLFKELPAESIKAIENLRTVSKGVSLALQDKIPTGRVAAFFDDNDGLLRRLMGRAISTAVTAKAGPLAASAVSEFINQSSNGAKSASAILAAPQFQSLIRTAVRDGVTEGAEITSRLAKAEKEFQKSRLFKRWEASLSGNDKAQLGALGTISYLLIDRDEE